MDGYSISPIGGLGLDPTGAYGSFDPMMTMMSSPYTMGAMNGIYGLGNMGAMGMGMMGYSPAFMANQMMQMAQIQNQMEKGKLNHATQMHQAIQDAEVQSLEAHDRAIFQKALVDADIKQGIRCLSDVIRKGDQDAICIEFDKLKQNIYTKYNSYFINNNKIDADKSVREIISLLYAQIVTAQNGGIPADLKTDIKQYGETAFWHGYNSTFLGNKGHNEKNSEETISYIFDERINDVGSKKRAEKWGSRWAKFSEGGLAGIAGYGAGLAGLFAGAGLLKSLPWVGKAIKFPSLKTAHGLGIAAGIAAIVGDIIWQNSRA